MNRTRVCFKPVLYFNILFILALLSPVEALPFDFSGWGHGASGYDDALDTSVNEEKPLIIYFRTDWCGWCKKLDNNYLSTPEVNRFLDAIPKVEINPEKSGEAKEVSEDYRVSGYPTFLVSLPSFDRRGVRISPFLKKGALSPEDFIGKIKKKISGYYNRQGYARHENGDYEEAVDAYRRAVKYNSDDAASHYGMGRTYENMGRREKDKDLMKKATDAYRKALAIDPRHVNSKKAMARLNKRAKKAPPGDGDPAESPGNRVEESEPDEKKDQGRGTVRYWVDENGVRHYSNY